MHGGAISMGRMTYAEFLVHEEASETKHEYVNGEVYAMAGGTIAHGAIAMAIGTELSNALRDRRCRVLSSDVRVRVAATGLSTYPDVTVVCGTIEATPDDPHGVLNPTIIVEVLSPSTEAYDRGAKGAHYRRIPSLREYVLVGHAEPLVEVWRRNERGNWELFVEARAGEQAELVSCGAPITLDVDAIYRDPLA
ncbi:MAG: Uma2 family endonuclease [Proteobacteria bacterium]|nr:Uma2 family endonuclease [Pseudomonadota bacterium]